MSTKVCGGKRMDVYPNYRRPCPKDEKIIVKWRIMHIIHCAVNVFLMVQLYIVSKCTRVPRLTVYLVDFSDNYVLFPLTWLQLNL